MKQYPSIPGSHSRKLPLGENCIGFYKYDGSNLRWEWNRKRGFYKHGMRYRQGMVCKGLKSDWAVKIKMLSYFEKLKTNYGQDWVKYAE